MVLAEGVEQQELLLASDGPPGTLKLVSYGQRQSTRAVLCCPGCYDCLEGPSCLFNRLASELPQRGYTVLCLAYRVSDDEEEAAEDVMTCIDWAEGRFQELTLLGWSMGSAAVVEAAYLRRHVPMVSGLITLAAQTSGTKNAEHLQEREDATNGRLRFIYEV